MKNKKVLTLAMIAGLTVGGLSVASVASAQSYGGDQDASASDTTDSNVEADTTDPGSIVLVQDEADGETPDAEATPGERNGRRGHRGGCNLDDAAEAIGIDEADLRAAVESGDTIADVAEANGVDVDTVIDSMVEAKAEHIAEKVDEGRITQEEADEKLADLEAKITDRVNGVEEAAGA